VIFDSRGGPVVFDQLVTVVAEVRGERDHLAVSYDSMDLAYLAELDIAEVIEVVRSQARRVWRAVCELPLSGVTAEAGGRRAGARGI